ncbi:hypothetical protein CRG98_023442 [Punica granatum]|uniref:Uncharacterized protein n=1 Tax=Punica granatum TaxID=22663 RepID=A0A2I0JIT5_PUNGR|nr:hypothetical protein CRG98_023442 [Punica granatum]
MEVRSRPQISGPCPESKGISNSRSQSIRGLGPPIGDPDPTLEVSGILCGCRQPRWWGRGRGRQPAAQAPCLHFGD